MNNIKIPTQREHFKVLVVEDEPGDARLIQRSLSRSSPELFSVSWAKTLAEGLRFLAGQEFDLVLLDLSLPDSCGFDTLQATCQAAGDTPVVVLTVRDDPGFALKTLDAGAQDYLIKGEFDDKLLARSLLYALARSRTEALQASRVKSEFLAKVSHELQTPLHAILSYADLGKEESRETGNQDLVDYFHKIQVSGSRLMYLVKDLLDVSRIEAGSLEYIFREEGMYDLALDTRSELDPLLKSKGIDLKIDCPPFPSRAMVDRARMMQVLQNLLHNSIKFSPRGSRIRVSFEQGGSPASPCLNLHVVDQGPGIPAREAEIIFEKFKQGGCASNKKQGTGLGLAICREIVHAHGGKIFAANEPRQGARFSISLPVNKKF